MVWSLERRISFNYDNGVPFFVVSEFDIHKAI